MVVAKVSQMRNFAPVQAGRPCEDVISMEELWELRRYLEAGDVDAALALLDEMEEMSRDDKITRIRSYSLPDTF